MSSDSKDSLPDDLALAEDEVVLNCGSAQEEVVIISKRSTYNDIKYHSERPKIARAWTNKEMTTYTPEDNVEQCFSLRLSYPDNCTQ